MTDIWRPDIFLIAAPGAPRQVAGYVYRGLGLFMADEGSPKRSRPPTWGLTHLGSGHSIYHIHGTVAVAFPIATEIAECGDWSFDGLRGYQNTDPDILDRALAIGARYPRQCKRRGVTDDAEAARAVAMARAE